MSQRSSLSTSTKPGDLGRSPSRGAAVPMADFPADDRTETPQVNDSTQNDNMNDSQHSVSATDAVLLNEVRGSLQTMSNGIDELAATVRDFLALDENGNSSDEYARDSKGKRVHIAWGRLRANAKARRRQRKLDARGPLRSSDDESENDEGLKKYPHLIPDVRECNFDSFQSRPAGVGHEVYCVDILIAGDELSKEINQFMETAAGIKSGKIQNWKPRHASDRTGDSSSSNSEKKWIRRIRVNSRAVMELLHFLTRGRTGRRPRPIVFYRPFQVLVSLHETLKDQLAIIKTCASRGTIEEPDIKTSGSTMSAREGWAKLIQKLGDNQHAINEITCFVDFMERRIMPDARRYRNPSSSTPKTIRSEDLWYLFKPGDLVYVPRDLSRRNDFRSTPSSQQFLRIIQTALGRVMPAPLGQTNTRPWSLFCHFIEHDGASYAPVHFLSECFTGYEGEKKITDLPVYPISFLLLPEDMQLLSQAQADGETYVSLIERRSGFYSGWTETIDPFGDQIAGGHPDTRITSPEHIESEILVDFQETFNALPSWKPNFYQTVAADEGFGNDFESLRPVELEDMPILERDEMGRVINDRLELHLTRDPTEQREAMKFISEDPLGQFRQTTRRAPTGQFLALLPRRFFGYAVLERKFVQLSTRFVRSAELEANDKAFENLQIHRKYKQLILALVKSHFDKVETEKKRNVEIESQDLIRGKGKGVVILLHGVPGVGKTATAEAVALKWKKPLFPITCGDLGYTAESLEKSLNEIFRLAHHWGCILLLDEADVFITQRERHDLKRNALVSAFLRVLEYYNGIMFLTTNRAGVLDEAIKSRVHLNLYYDHLTEDQTVSIFRQHIQRLRNIEKQRNPDQNEQIMVLHKEILQFARDHYNQRGNNQGSGGNFGRWNGRQIRNAFLIASSLAHYDSEEEGGEDNDELAEHGRKKQKQLGRSQFELVAETTLMYDQYRQSVHSGKSDDHVAFEREERAMSSQPRSPTPVRMKSSSMGIN